MKKIVMLLISMFMVVSVFAVNPIQTEIVNILDSKGIYNAFIVTDNNTDIVTVYAFTTGRYKTDAWIDSQINGAFEDVVGTYEGQFAAISDIYPFRLNEIYFKFNFHLIKAVTYEIASDQDIRHHLLDGSPMPVRVDQNK